MNNYRWFNPHLPQTLQIAVLLLYLNAFFMFLGREFAWVFGLILIVGFVAGGFGIANEKKWGYLVGLGAATLRVVLALFSLNAILHDGGLLLGFMFDVALVALLAHPQSREYQKIWFR
ncbi:MAG: hypothetical protein QOI55_1810 [Actinomycetota bacterium]|nr:hypothetical protein [Actinomycetota bacterium]